MKAMKQSGSKDEELSVIVWFRNKIGGFRSMRSELWAVMEDFNLSQNTLVSLWRWDEWNQNGIEWLSTSKKTCLEFMHCCPTSTKKQRLIIFRLVSPPREKRLFLEKGKNQLGKVKEIGETQRERKEITHYNIQNRSHVSEIRERTHYEIASLYMERHTSTISDSNIFENLEMDNCRKE